MLKNFKNNIKVLKFNTKKEIEENPKYFYVQR